MMMAAATSTRPNNPTTAGLSTADDPISPATNSKRARACAACHSIKIKCELGSRGGPPPCARCVRLGKECVVTPPKRQKDRVAELEAQVEALTRMLEKQGMTSGDQERRSSDEEMRNACVRKDSTPRQQKKRRLEDEYDVELEDEKETFVSPIDGIPMDTVISRDQQRRIFDRYTRLMIPIYPLIPLPDDCDYESMRKSKPVLLQAIVYAASPSVVAENVQDEVSKVMLDIFADRAMAAEEKSIELLQAMHLVLLWFRSSKYQAHFTVWQLIAVQAGLAEELRISAPSESMSHNPFDTAHTNPPEVWRSRLVCYLLSISMGTFTRKTSDQPWGEFEQNALEMLEYSQLSLSSDRLLCQYVRAERLCAEIVSRSDFCSFPPTTDHSDPMASLTRQNLADLITDYKSQIRPSLNLHSIAFWEPIAIIYLHESVLHTATNRRSFEAPFIAERLSVTDFPIPAVTPEHINSLHALKNAIHQALDIFTGIPPADVVRLPSLVFAARIAYCEIVLLKLYIAVTAVGNTFGAYLNPAELLVEEYLQKIIETAIQILKIDPRCSQVRILSASSRLKEWLQNYKATQLSPLSMPATLIGGGGGNIGSEPAFADVNNALDTDFSGWAEMNFEDDAFGYGLADLFADPVMTSFLLNATNPGEQQQQQQPPHLNEAPPGERQLAAIAANNDAW